MNIALVMPPAPALAGGFWFLQKFAAPLFLRHTVSAWLCGTGPADAAALPWRGGPDALFCRESDAQPGDDAGMLDWLHAMYETERPALVLVYGNIAGHTLAARLASRVGCGCFSDAAGLEGGEALTAWKRVCSSNLLWKKALFPLPFVLCAAPQTADIPCEAPNAVPLAREFPALGKRALPESLSPESPAQNPLETAAFVCVGGRGLGGAENADKLRALAAALGAAVGFSRAAAMNGWGPMEAVVGQSGVRLRTGAACLALGVSGSAAFLAGLGGVKSLLAVNTDPNAPIFRRADVGLVADAGTTLDQLLAALQT